MKTIFISLLVLGIIVSTLVLVSCSPTPRASYGLHKYLKATQNLKDVEVDIKVGGTAETMWACTKESLRRGEIVPILFSLGLIPGCVWLDIWVEPDTSGNYVGTVKRCSGYATPGTYAHELEHCKGYKDHPLLEIFN